MSEAKKPQTNDRPGWDKTEWDAKAKAKDQHFAEQAKARDEALAQGTFYIAAAALFSNRWQACLFPQIVQCTLDMVHGS